MYKQLKLLIIIVIAIAFILPTKIDAKTTNNSISLNEVSKYVQIQAKNNQTKKNSQKSKGTSDVKTIKNKFDKGQSCNSLLGDPGDESTVAWLLIQILNYFRILGPLAVIVLSGIEFTKTIILSDEDHMKKAKNHLITRLILVIVLFLVPTFTKLLLEIFNIVSDPMCGIN